MHIDELLGVVTIAAAGMFAAIAVQPLTRGAPGAADIPARTAAPIVRLPSVDVVARRSVEVARVERQEKFARPPLAKDGARPKA